MNAIELPVAIEHEIHELADFTAPQAAGKTVKSSDECSSEKGLQLHRSVVSGELVSGWMDGY